MLDLCPLDFIHSEVPKRGMGGVSTATGVYYFRGWTPPATQRVSFSKPGKR